MSAIDRISEELENMIKDIIKNSMRNARLSERKTIKAEDLEFN